MNEGHVNIYRSYLRWYWGIWVLFVLGFIVLRVTIFKYIDEPFNLFTTYALSSWIPLGILSMIEYLRITQYLEKHHKETWEYITSSRWAEGTGWYNSLRFLRFLKSKDNFGDPILEKMKLDNKSLFKLILTVFWTLPILFIWSMEFS